jgi:hypothetical protein
VHPSNELRVGEWSPGLRCSGIFRTLLRGLPGYWVVLFDRAAFDCPADSPSAHLYASEVAVFQAPEPLDIGMRSFRG